MHNIGKPGRFRSSMSGHHGTVADLANLDMIGRLLLAAGLGAALGTEREMDGQDAGLRTHLLLALGAALFGLISVGAWDHFAAPTQATNFRVDVTRVASYVAAGVGFLGGGTIVKHAGGVRGLTTASSLWVAAAVGLACGVGFVVPALTATAAALFSLLALKPVRQLVRRVGAGRSGTLVVNLRDAAAFGELVRVLHEDTALTPLAIRGGPSVTGRGFEVAVDYAPANPYLMGQLAERIARLADVDEVHIR